MRRRNFLKLSGGLLLTTPLSGWAGMAGGLVVIATLPVRRSAPGGVSPDQVNRLFERGLRTLFSTASASDAWRQIIRPSQTVGLKVNCLSGRGTTRLELVDAVTESLQGAGIPASRIIVWDRFSSDLEDAGFRIRSDPNRIRCFGNDQLGFEDDFQVYGSAASLLCRTITRECDVIINLPVLKDHGIAGITACMKNFFGAIHNPNKYHVDAGDPYIADVYSFKPVRTKTVLHVCDAIDAQYEGGPSYMPHWTWPCDSLLLSRDPVALDYTGWQIIESERRKRGLKSLREAGREPRYILTAGDPEHRLGCADPAKIELIKV